MKKMLVAIIAVLYMGVSSGIAMDIHYCMGKKAGADFYGSTNEKCGKCGMKDKANGCCKDEHKFYKLNDSHKTVSNELQFEIPFCIVPQAYKLYKPALFYDVALSALKNHSPPLAVLPSRYILFGVFRI